ncbi:hypothetical protein EFP20_04535 [Burkholderia glumae]|nr:hypothetical protein CEQ24_025980 [Burkholderia glumae]UVS89500.1 hypothetical protein EFP17_06625 [Burkholderia glumae]UVT01008.1 hypothetical protein EFP20_04535 [Burkholderia glumae]
MCIAAYGFLVAQRFAQGDSKKTPRSAIHFPYPRITCHAGPQRASATWLIPSPHCAGVSLHTSRVGSCDVRFVQRSRVTYCHSKTRLVAMPPSPASPTATAVAPIFTRSVPEKAKS